MIERAFKLEEPRHTLTFEAEPDENFKPINLTLPEVFMSDDRFGLGVLLISRAVKGSCTFDRCNPLIIVKPRAIGGGNLILASAGFKCRCEDSCPLQNSEDGDDETGDREPREPEPAGPYLSSSEEIPAFVI